MADRNSRGLSGNGILSGLTLGVPASDPNDPNAEFGLRWAQAIRQAQEQQSQDISSSYGETTPYGALQRSVDYGSAPSNTWPPVDPGAAFGAVHAPFMMPPPVALQIAPRLPSEFDHEGSPRVLPASYQDSQGRRTWWGPPVVFDPWQEWRDQFRKGMQGLINFLDANRGIASSGGRNDEDCYDRWQREVDRCFREFWPLQNRRPWAACKDRARDRHNLCIQNGDRPDPNEPDEYDWNDIPKDNPGN